MLKSLEYLLKLASIIKPIELVMRQNKRETMHMSDTIQTKKSPFLWLHAGLGFTLFILLIMGWNVYWENLKHLRVVEQQQITLQQDAKVLSPALYNTKQQQLKNMLSRNKIDITITVIVVLFTIIILCLCWYLILSILSQWQQQLTDTNQKLEELNQSLDHKVQLRTNQLHKEMHQKQQLTNTLQQNQKLQAIGTLAAGIAHDYNNYLAIMLAHTEFLRGKVTDQQAQQATNSIITTIEKGSHLTQQLLSFARRGKHQLKNINLNQAVQQATEMLQASLPETTKLEIQLESELWTVAADMNQVIQVLLNLGLNARDAIADTGVITFTTSNQDYSLNSLPNAEIKPGKYVRIDVKDTGMGIKPENLQHLFEPFYTTKAIGKGTGLGLAVAYGIMQQHKGHLSVNSTVNVGSTFSLHIPL